MSPRLLLDEHYANEIAERLRAQGYDVVSVVGDSELRAQPDLELFGWAVATGRRIVTENIKDFRERNRGGLIRVMGCMVLSLPSVTVRSRQLVFSGELGCLISYMDLLSSSARWVRSVDAVPQRGW